MALCLNVHALAQDCQPAHNLTAQSLLTMDFAEQSNQLTPLLDHDKHYRLRDVRVVRQNVFPRERHLVARLANRFHTITRESVIRTSLPFAPGDMVNPKQLEEAERLLRFKPYLYDAAVLIRSVCGEAVDIDVVVRDVWTLNPSLELSRSGGENKSGFGVADVNMMGSGKLVALRYRRTSERDEIQARYVDPNLAGTRWLGEFEANRFDDGEQLRAALIRPFYALDVKWSGGVSIDHSRHRQQLEYQSEDLVEFDAKTALARVFGGYLIGRQRSSIDRLLVGVAFKREEFRYPEGFVLPRDRERKYVYPFVGWQHVPDRVRQETNVFRVGVREDIEVGVRSYVELGWSSDSFGGKGNVLLIDGELEGNWFVGPHQLVRAHLGLNARRDLDENRTEDLWLTLSVAHVWQQAPKWRAISSVMATRTRALALDKQLSLGGDSGLRGYPSRYQTGDHSYLLSVEQRYLPRVFPWGLFRLGFAAFADVGKAWYRGRPPAYIPEGRLTDTLSNVGVGLRIESVRTRRDRTIFVDVAKPLAGGPNVRGLEVSVTVRQSL